MEHKDVRHDIQRFEDDMGGPIIVGRFELITDIPWAEVDVVVSRRRIIDYVLRPLLKAKYNWVIERFIIMKGWNNPLTF